MQTRRALLTQMAGLVAAPLVSPRRSHGASVATAPVTPGHSRLGTGDIDWREVAGRFRLDPEQHFFNTGTLGSCPDVVHERVVETIRQLDTRPTFNYWARCMPAYFEVRRKAAQLLGASDPESVTLTHSTTEGINIVVRGLDLKAGDEVVTTSHEHLGGSGPWRGLAAQTGVQVRTYDLPTSPPSDKEIVEGLERLITPRTRVLMVSHVLYTNGLIMPVEAVGELAAAHGLRYLIDGAHPVGQMPLEIESTGCDFYAASGHKWLCGPKGTGFLYVKSDRIKELSPLLASYDPHHIPKGFEAFDRGATRLNFVWTNNLHDIMGLEAAIDFHMELGPEKVRERCLSLTRRFRDGASGIADLEIIDVGEEKRSTPMTTLRVSGKSNKEAFRQLSKMGYKVKEVLDAELPEPLNAIRVCTHIFNTESQVDGLLMALEEMLSPLG